MVYTLTSVNDLSLSFPILWYENAFCFLWAELDSEHINISMAICLMFPWLKFKYMLLTLNLFSSFFYHHTSPSHLSYSFPFLHVFLHFNSYKINTFLWNKHNILCHYTGSTECGVRRLEFCIPFIYNNSQRSTHTHWQNTEPKPWIFEFM